MKHNAVPILKNVFLMQGIVSIILSEDSYIWHSVCFPLVSMGLFITYLFMALHRVIIDILNVSSCTLQISPLLPQADSRLWLMPRLPSGHQHTPWQSICVSIRHLINWVAQVGQTGDPSFKGQSVCDKLGLLGEKKVEECFRNISAEFKPYVWTHEGFIFCVYFVWPAV